MTTFSPAALDAAFAILEAAAVKGERCPKSRGPDACELKSAHVSALAKAGRIFVEISSHNWRVVTILTGPNKGARTLSNPDKHAHVWQTVGAEGTKINGRFSDLGAAQRNQPSLPRLLTSAEIAAVRS